MLLLLFYYSISNSLARFKMSIYCKVWKHVRAHAHARTMMDTVLFQGDNWLYFPASEALFSERGFSLTRAHGEQNRASRARFSSAVGIYRRCANDEWARDAQRKAERATERKLMRKRDSGRKKIRQERGREGARGLTVTRRVERCVTQVQSSAPACPRAIPVQQRQEAAEHQWPQERQVRWKNKQTSQTQQNNKREEKRGF